MTVNVENLRARCDALLTAILGAENVQWWWDSRNNAFDMMTGNEAFEQDPEKVYNYLMFQAYK